VTNEITIKTRHCYDRHHRFPGYALCGLAVSARRDAAWADAWFEIDCLQCLQAMAFSFETLAGIGNQPAILEDGLVKAAGFAVPISIARKPESTNDRPSPEDKKPNAGV
jgi:hypothetical protein